MKIVTKLDILYAIVTGLTAGIIAWLVLTFLQSNLPFGFGPAWLVFVLPILWIGGVQLGYVLGRWFGFFNQFGKYVAIGFTNFAVDAGIFNLLLSFTHKTEGGPLVIQKTISFIFAVTHSYFWNRRWSFASAQANTRSEYIKFMLVNVIALAVNVGVAYLVVHSGRPATFTPEAWANIGAVAGSAAALIFSFVGFKIFVFDKK